jgi:predicted PurR-regulated permease PerM
VSEVRGPDRLRRATLWVWATIGALILAAGLFWMAGQVHIIWIPLVLAAGVVVILDPLVGRIQRSGVPRVFAIVIAYLLSLGLLVALGFLLVPPIRQQFSEFVAQFPTIYDRTVVWLQDLGDRLGIDLGPVWTSQTIVEWLRDPANQETIQEYLGGFGTGAGRVLRGFTETLLVLLLVPVLAFYLLLDLPRFRRTAPSLVPPGGRAEVSYLGGNVFGVLTGFVRGQLLVAAIVGVMSSLALRLVDVPFWLIIGLISGVLNLVPFVGPFVGGMIAAFVALLEGSPGKAILAVLALTAVQQIDNHIVTPIVLRSRVQLSPFSILMALLIGGSVAGLLGVLVAVPVLSVVRVIVGHLWRTRMLGESWEEATEAMIERSPPPPRILPQRLRPPGSQARLFDTAEIETAQVDRGAEPGPPPGSPG